MILQNYQSTAYVHLLYVKKNDRCQNGITHMASWVDIQFS